MPNTDKAKTTTPATDPSPEAREAADKLCREMGLMYRGQVLSTDSETVARALDAFRREGVEKERGRFSTFRASVEDARSAIFYWMTRNHHRGEQSYSQLGEAKERLTAAIKLLEDFHQ